ncbi:MAG: hypothetical protein WCF26_22970 [Candidatus Sulfotelmatobacter sp.]
MTDTLDRLKVLINLSTPSSQSLLDALAQTVPLSTTRAEEIATLRDWANTRAVPASARDAKSSTA